MPIAQQARCHLVAQSHKVCEPNMRHSNCCHSNSAAYLVHSPRLVSANHPLSCWWTHSAVIVLLIPQACGQVCVGANLSTVVLLSVLPNRSAPTLCCLQPPFGQETGEVRLIQEGDNVL